MTKYVFLLLFSLLTHKIHSQQVALVDSLKLALSEEKNPDQRFNLYRSLCSAYYNDKPAIAIKMLDSMRLYTNANDRLKNGIIALHQAAYESRLSNLDAGITYGKMAVELLSFPDGAFERAKALGNLGMVKRRKGEYKSASEYILKALRLKDSLGIEKIEMAFDYHTLAAVYGDLKNFEKSSDYFKKARDIYVNYQRPNYVKYMDINLATNLVAQGNYTQAEEIFLECASYFKKVNNFFTETTIYLELGQLFLKKEEFDTAEFYLRKVIDRRVKLNHKEVMAVTMSKLGEVLYKKGNYQEALPYLLSSSKSNESSGAIGSMATDYGRIAKVYASTGAYKKAYQFNAMKYKIEDSLTGQKNLETLNALTVAYETEKKDAALVLQGKEILLLEEKNNVERLSKSLFAIGMFSLLIIAGLLYFGFTQKIKKNKIASHKQQEIFENELKFKKKELTSQTLHLVKKNTLIQELKDTLEKAKKTPESFQKEIRRMFLLLKREAAEDKNWEVFKSYFSQVHNDFDAKIKTAANDVTEKEIRLASFLRMNLSTKEIASMFNVLPDSVLTSKYRLKKKLNLPKEEDLSAFLHQL